MLKASVNDELLKTDDLMHWSGIQQPAALRRWLDAEPYPIPYKVSPKGVICTTLSAVTEALRRREGGAWEA